MSANGDKRFVAGRYELLDELGAGGMGVVWRARDRLLGREVAVKEVSLAAGMEPARRAALRARVTREARAAARLNHPGAVTVYDIVTDGDRDLIVMELVEAPTLDELVRERGPLDPPAAAALGLRLLATLRAAHRAGIVHRDLKPKNVMVGEGGASKLADFGVASLQGDPALTATGLVIGSPAYMAPEQVEGGPVTAATDLWALGATLWFAVEGEAPFGGGEFHTLSAIVHGAPRPARRLGPLAPVLAGLLAKDPGARTGAGELQAQLERIALEGSGSGSGAGLDQTQVLAQPLPLPPPRPAAGGGRRRRGRPLPPVPVPAAGGLGPVAARPRPRRPLRLALALLLAAALAGAGGLLLLQRGGGTGGRQASRAAHTPRAAVPAGWRAYTAPGGAYRLAYPPGWSPVPRGAFTDFVSPDRGRFFRVQPTSDGLAPLAAQRSLERSFVARHPGGHYQRIRLGPATFKDRAAAEWEFTVVLDGRARHGYDLTFLAGGRRHAILFQTAAADWAGAREQLRAFLAGFRPAA
jgi:eukaryotic-like serine/threonine-protein kinase